MPGAYRPYHTLTEVLPSHRQAYSDRTALLMALLSKIAYNRPSGSSEPPLAQRGSAGDAATPGAWDEALLERQLSELGCRLIATAASERTAERTSGARVKKLGAQGFAAENEDMAFLVFRGSDSWRDWKNNLRARLVPMEVTRPGGREPAVVRVHRGFKEAFDRIGPELLDQLLPRLRDNGGDTHGRALTKPLYLAGHSLGGAMAVIATIALEPHNLAACYTFGAPRVGDSWVDRELKTPHYRIIHGHDAVPALPPEGLSRYRHTGSPVTIQLGEPPWIKRSHRNGLIGFANSAFSFVGWLLNGGPSPVSQEHHRLDIYIEKLERLAAIRANYTPEPPTPQ